MFDIIIVITGSALIITLCFFCLFGITKFFKKYPTSNSREDRPKLKYDPISSTYTLSYISYKNFY